MQCCAASTMQPMQCRKYYAANAAALVCFHDERRHLTHIFTSVLDLAFDSDKLSLFQNFQKSGIAVFLHLYCVWEELRNRSAIHGVNKIHVGHKSFPGGACYFGKLGWYSFFTWHASVLFWFPGTIHDGTVFRIYLDALCLG